MKIGSAAHLAADAPWRHEQRRREPVRLSFDPAAPVLLLLVNSMEVIKLAFEALSCIRPMGRYQPVSKFVGKRVTRSLRRTIIQIIGRSMKEWGEV